MQKPYTWLLYGADGWIGGQLVSILENQGQTIIKGRARIDNYDSVYNEVLKVNANRVICTTGRTSGPGYPNIDYLEQPSKLTENLRDNLKGPMTISQVCGQVGVHLTYLGTGCLYEYDSSHPIENPLQKGFTEVDEPNFLGSQYSIVKGITDRLINKMPNVMNARIRMPISNQVNPRNFITKITQYAKVISIPNSMTVLPELLPIMIDLAKREYCGPVNLTNPGAITHQEILDLYIKYVDPEFKYEIMDLQELSKYTSGRRSNNFLSTEKLESLYKVRPIKEAVEDTLREMGNNIVK